MDKLGKLVGKIMYGWLPNSEDAWYAINKDENWLITKQSFRIILSKIFTRHSSE